LKSLAFRIKKNRKAHFTLINVAAPPEAVAELERTLSINEDVLRFLTIRVYAHEAGPSAMLRKREDSEREERSSRSRGERGDRPPRRQRDDANVGAA
ncbi:MAG: 30S ribosomal protein S6, partial [Hyphomicrobiales bacterium]|nr:30S ribosomal protein S6 [Hyphomicrobiales bacterium]